MQTPESDTTTTHCSILPLWNVARSVNKNNHTDGLMSDPSIAEAFKQFSQATLCSAPEYLPHNSPAHSFQLRAYKQGTPARLNQICDDLLALRRERDDALRDLKTKHESGLQRW
jgi:hypothetical protein